uniref:Uncharacterized protein n=1 Tax=Rhizophora mucronata TaxID=61149 RepID=A0A2P2NIZ4_RHIMU
MLAFNSQPQKTFFIQTWDWLSQIRCSVETNIGRIELRKSVESNIDQIELTELIESNNRKEW